MALQVAPIAAQNKVLFISGPAATDAVTAANRYTFRSGRQSYQDVVTAKSFIGDPTGKKVVVFAQDGAFGDANEAAVKAVIGGAGATVSSVRAPASATEFTPFASQIKAAKPDLLFVAWAGTTAPAMWQTLDQQGGWSWWCSAGRAPGGDRCSAASSTCTWTIASPPSAPATRWRACRRSSAAR
ncbi:hypothetical protein GCM10010429_15240 [Micromonospora olivasterospora]